MSKRKFRKRNLAHGKPQEKTFKMMWDAKLPLLRKSIEIENSKNMVESVKRIILIDLLEYMQRLTDRLIKRGAVINPEAQKKPLL